MKNIDGWIVYSNPPFFIVKLEPRNNINYDIFEGADRFIIYRATQSVLRDKDTHMQKMHDEPKWFRTLDESLEFLQSKTREKE